jgi:hypothetical protein
MRALPLLALGIMLCTLPASAQDLRAARARHYYEACMRDQTR